MRKARRFLLLVVLIIGGLSPNHLAYSRDGSFSLHDHNSLLREVGRAQTSLSTRLYLPVARSASLFQDDLPIWANTSLPGKHEVVLFRHSFRLQQPVSQVSLSLFADTRYEVWLDGEWVGRGPARFSKTVREYDIYLHNQLLPGDHLLAVLVQWAPNNRRSESVTPLLQGHLRGITLNGAWMIERTGSQWKAMLSQAWREDAVPVHAWELIGPTELLDFRRLPANWNRPGFQDEDWPQAVVKDPLRVDYQPLLVPRLDSGSPFLEYEPASRSNLSPQPTRLSTIVYQPRSIPLLDSIPVSPTLVDTGFLSPGRAMVELTPSDGDPYPIAFRADAPTIFRAETLSTTVSAPVQFKLDGADLALQPAGSLRPDVFVSAKSIPKGLHSLKVSGIQSQGSTLSVSTKDIRYSNLPFEQGSHAGRRLLLAEPASSPQPVIITSTQALDIKFTSLPAYLVLDLGRTISGRLSAEISGPEGTVVDIGWDERLLAGTKRPLPFPGSFHPQWNQVDSWVLDGTSRSLTTIDTRAGRYLLIAVWGQAPVRLKNLHVVEERYPLVQNGTFHSSDALLDSIWQTGVVSAYPNMTDAYTDTPWRERGQWWGDSYVIDHVNQVAFGDHDLLKRGLVAMANAFTGEDAPGAAPNSNGTNMLDYAMLWVHALADYSRRTGDTQILFSTYPVLLQFMEHLQGYENAQTGLIDLPQEHWSKTVYIDMLGYYSRYGQSTAVNALYYKTLQEAAWIAGKVSDSQQSINWGGKAGMVKESLNRTLYLPLKGRYLTNIYQGTPYPPTPQAQAWALAYGLVPENERERVADALVNLLSPDPSNPNLEVFGFYWVLEALGQAGKIEPALGIIKNYYGYLLNQGATTWWENMNANQYFWASLSHGWGGAPTWFLSTYLLGVRQLGPDTWQVKPAFQGVNRVSGRLPLENSQVEVAWERRTCGETWLQLGVGPGSAGEVVYSFTDPSLELTLNGDPIFAGGKPLEDIVSLTSTEIRIALESGSFTLVARQACR